MAFQSVKQLLERAAAENRPLWETILEDDIHSQNLNREESLARMRYFWEAMKASVDSYHPADRSNSGLVGGDGEKVRIASEKGLLFGGTFFNEVVSEALKVSESNACMKRIVAMPTAGSCGVIPAVLVPLIKKPARFPTTPSSRPCMWPPASDKSSPHDHPYREPRAVARLKSAPHRQWPPPR